MQTNNSLSIVSVANEIIVEQNLQSTRVDNNDTVTERVTYKDGRSLVKGVNLYAQVKKKDSETEKEFQFRVELIMLNLKFAYNEWHFVRGNFDYKTNKQNILVEKPEEMNKFYSRW